MKQEHGFNIHFKLLNISVLDLISQDVFIFVFY